MATCSHQPLFLETMRKETLLRLLLLHDGLETAEAWAATLEDRREQDVATDAVVRHDEQEGGRAPLIAAIELVVPHLPDYSAVSSQLKALMCYSEKVSSAQVNLLVQGWLQQAHSVRFRRWVIRDWLKCSHLTSAEPTELLQWRHALMVATTNETVKPLKRTLLGFLNALDETIETRSEGDENSITSAAASQSIETVEDLLDFCFLHVEQLASCSLLCAAKLHALAVRTQRSAIKLLEDDEVMVRLRWSLMLKPMLFKPLLQHAVALKAVPGKITASQLWASEALAGLVALVDIASRESILLEMTATRDELERVFTCGAEHIHDSASKPKGPSVLEAAVGKYVQTLSVETKKLLLAELERDLDEAPPHLFPHIFMFFGLNLSATLLSTTPEDQGLLIEAVDILFALFDRRSHDADSCLDVLGLLLQLSLADNPIWLDDSPLYLETIESLSETATLQVEPKLKWAAKMALQELLVECDVHLLARNQATLSQLLPPCTMRLVTIQLGS